MPIENPSFVAVDWGTSSFRLWLVSGTGDVLTQTSGPHGMGTLTPAEYAPLLERQMETLGVAPDIPVLISGMAGAKGGWVEAPYLAHDSDLADLAKHATRVTGQPRDIRILPGLKQRDPANVMRGEETQIIGLLAHNPDFDGIVALPGTHTKWVHLSKNRIEDFATCMTGEIFQLLSRQSVLRHSMAQDAWDEAAFLSAVDEALHDPQSIAVTLFGLRAEMLLAGLTGAAARGRLSGLLIGFELAATRGYWLQGRVALIGAPELCHCYSKALAPMGIKAETLDAQTMTLAGLTLARTWITEHGDDTGNHSNLAGDHTGRGEEPRTGAG